MPPRQDALFQILADNYLIQERMTQIMNPPTSSLKKGSKESLTSVKSEEPPSSPATTHISIQVTHRSSKSGRSHILPLLLLIIAAVFLLFLLTVFPGSVSVFFSLNT